MSDTWERLRPTIERIVMKRQCTIAEAQRELIEACSEGRIRTFWLGRAWFYDQSCPPIPKTDWIAADIDLDNDRIVKASGERMQYVGFSRDDREGWLEQNAPLQTLPEVGQQTPLRNGSGVRKTKHAAAEEDCGNWIGSQPEKPRQRKIDVKKAALARFSYLSEKAFERQWAAHAPDSWKTQGRF